MKVICRFCAGGYHKNSTAQAQGENMNKLALIALIVAAILCGNSLVKVDVVPTLTPTPTATLAATFTPTPTATATLTSVPTRTGTLVAPSPTPDDLLVVYSSYSNGDDTSSAVLPLGSSITLRNGTQDLLVTYTRSVSVESDVTITISSGSDKLYECENCYPNHGETIDTGFGVDYVVGDYSVTIIFPSDWEVEKK